MNRTEESFSSRRNNSEEGSRKSKRGSNSISDVMSLSMSSNREGKNENLDDISPSSPSTSNTSFFGNNTVAIVLVILLVFPAIGLTILSFLGNTYTGITTNSQPVITGFLKLLGYSTGTVINQTADVAGDAAKIGVDILEGSVHNVGNLVQGKTGDYPTSKDDIIHQNSLDAKIQKKIDAALSQKLIQTTGNTVSTTGGYRNPADAKPDHSDNKIQNPISASKAGWCLTGEYQNKRGCVSVSESDQCLSGQIFPSKEMCLNPTLTP